MKKRIKLIIKILAIILVLGVVIYLLWHYRFLYRETVHLSYNADEVTEIKILAMSQQISAEEYNEGKRRMQRSYHINNKQEIEKIVEELNSIELKKLDYFQDGYIIRSFRGKQFITIWLYNNKKLINSIVVRDKLIHISNATVDVSLADYLVADYIYKDEEVIPPLNKYFIK